jgi:dimethylaniline monooxygenase (N-oxide forming)
MMVGGAGVGSTRVRKRIAVVGGGPAGLVALKELKEKGHDVVVFEARAAVGGVFTDSYDTLQLTSSSVVTSFGSHIGGNPARPVIWRGGEYVRYLSEFADRFDLMPHVRLRTAVRSIHRGPDGGWRLRVEVTNGEGRGAATGDELEFDHVVICCGPNARPQFPAWADPSKFDGRLCHSADIRHAEEFAGKRVLMFGMGESGSDLALMAARVATSCAISTRVGPGYLIPRYYRGLPSDLDTNRCYHSLPRTVIGKPIVRFKVRIEDTLLGETEDVEVARKCAEINRARGKSPFHRFGTKSTGFVEAMVHHGATYHPAVAALERDHVVFVDGGVFHCDLIVCCTGFAPEFPFLQEHEPVLAMQGRNARARYKRMIVPEAGTDIAWIGYVRPGLGSVPPCAEMQARYLAQLISGERTLPSVSEMERDIKLHADLDLQQFGADAERVAALTDFFRFMETMAEVIGCRPRLGRLFLRDPRTALSVLFGPLCPAQYRLTGPGADWARARAALRRLPTMPWPVLAYELLMFVGCWLAGLMREEWRRSRVDAPALPAAEGNAPVRADADAAVLE